MANNLIFPLDFQDGIYRRSVIATQEAIWLLTGVFSGDNRFRSNKEKIMQINSFVTQAADAAVHDLQCQYPNRIGGRHFHVSKYRMPDT